MANVPYANFVLENKLEDQFKSHLDLQQFCKIDTSLSGVAGMKKKIHVYTATDGTEKLTLGKGNNKTIEASYTEKEYEILLAQNRGVWYDEEQMTDPMIGFVIARHAATDMFNTMKEDLKDEYGNESGESAIIYKPAVKMDANVSAATGSAQVEQFGNFAG